jgi:hypothetical protein
MRIHPAVAVSVAVLLFGRTALGQSAVVTERDDAYHLQYWKGSAHLPNYTEWWYFNVYDSSNDVQAIFSYLVNNPLNQPGGLFWFGIADMAAVVYSPGGVVTESDFFFAPSLSAGYDNADVKIGDSNGITVIDPNTYRIFGTTRDGRLAWNLRYERAAPPWYAANSFQVSAEPWQQMSWLLYMPRASVSGTLRVDGKTYQIAAPGYHDHNWGEWDLNNVTWNWAQYSQPELTFDLGDFPGKPGGVASLGLDGQRFVFNTGQYALVHTKWAYDLLNKLYYPTQSIFLGSDGPAQIYVVMDVQKTDPLSAPVFPPKAVIYEQTAKYTGVAWVNGKYLTFAGSGFKEFTGVAH